MKLSTSARRSFASLFSPRARRPQTPGKVQTICARCWKSQVRYAHTPADDPNWVSMVDNPATPVRTGRKHGPGLILLALIPVTAFALGTWQVQRLDQKTKLVAKLEDSLVKHPLSLPPVLNPDAVPEFDYRRVYATGWLRHDKEMLIGPRLHDGKDGFLVITPLEREDGASTVLVNRGWISKDKQNQRNRPESVPRGKVTVEGLLRVPFKKNMFTPENKPEEGKFYFPDVKQMAELTGSQPIWMEETLIPELTEFYRREAAGIPIAREPELNLRNNHAQYIFTWYGLSLATAIMFWMVVRKQPNEVARRVRKSKSW